MMGAAQARARVLVVDDEPQVLVALEDLLCDDYDVLKSESGEHALDLVGAHRDIAVVVSDQRMPNMTGDQLFSRIQARSSAARVLVTGFADMGAVVRAVNEGRIFAYVDKPWDPARLRMVIDSAAEHYRLQHELNISEERLRLVVAGTGAGLFDCDLQTGFVHFSPEFARLLKEPAGTLAPVFDSFLLRLHPNDVYAVMSQLDGHRDPAPPATLDCRLRMANGDYRWFSLSAVGVRDSAGVRTRLVGALCDVTDRKLQEERLTRLSRVRALTSAVNAKILHSTDRKSLLRGACDVAVRAGELAFAAAFARRDDATMEFVACDSLDEPLREELPSGLSWRAIAETPEVLDALLAGRSYVMNDTRAVPEVLQSHWFATRSIGALALFPMVFDGSLHGVYFLGARPVGYFDTGEVELLSELAPNLAFGLELEAKNQRLSFVLSNDPLTGLARRDLFLDRLQQRLVACNANLPALAVFWVDVNRFRQVNEALGRVGGDTLLREVGKRLVQAAQDVDAVARLDANSFGIISTPLAKAADSSALLDAITTALNEPFVVHETEVRIAVTVGVSLYPEDGNSAERLVSDCETAGKVAKSAGQPYAFYAAQMNQRVAARMALESELRKAIELRQFVLHYQPKVSARTGKVTGLEALVRWNDPASGLVAPGIFIPVLEETGLILKVGTWVLEEAARQYSEWTTQGLAPPRIAVNISPIQLAGSAFDASVDRVLALYPGAAQGIDLEITESVLMGDMSSTIEKLRRARSLGFKVAIDDFGTGYSSLGYLQRLPLDALKVDRSFIKSMDQHAQDMSLVMTIISLGSALGLTVIAEGVETPQQARLLALLRCDELQGFLMSKPVPAEQVPALLKQSYAAGGTFEPSPGGLPH